MPSTPLNLWLRQRSATRPGTPLLAIKLRHVQRKSWIVKCSTNNLPSLNGFPIAALRVSGLMCPNLLLLDDWEIQTLSQIPEPLIHQTISPLHQVTVR
jgi:hypothetical protein